jgi:surface protein
MKQKKLLVLALLALGLVFSCSKDDGPTPPETKAPTISGFSPNYGPVGQVFVITGTNFSTTASKNTVKIGTVTATVSAATATKITTSVPQGATTAKVSVTVGGKTISSTDNFTVTQPQAGNKAPTISTTSLSAAEDLQGGAEVGTVAASDADGDALTFSMTDEAGIFDFDTATGKISLAEGKTLDFETDPEYTVTIGVSDGKGGTASQLITINVTDVDEVPTISDQGFDAAEDIADDVEIGTVVAADPEGATLAYSIKTDDSGLFEIDENGVLSLLAGKTLDFETLTEHTLTVEVTDGTTDPVTAEITITVTNVIENLADDPESFVTTWVTTAPDESIVIGVYAVLPYDYTIDWGDGTVETITDSNDPTHIYAQAGTHTVAIKGLFPAIRMHNGNLLGADKDKLASIEQWGTYQWATMEDAFRGCINMVYNATDIPDLSSVTNLSGMFSATNAFNGDLSGWDVSTVTEMNSMFAYATAFNGDLSAWEMQNVQEVIAMFRGATSFEGIGLSGWDTGNVLTMASMFAGATSFDQNLGSWNLGSLVPGDQNQFMAGALEEAFDSSGLSPANYDATLIGWNANQNTPNDIILGAFEVTYCSQGGSLSRQQLIQNKGWTITDGGPNCNP